MSRPGLSVFVPAILLSFAPGILIAQFSLGLQAGYVSNFNHDPDPYALDALWPLKSSTTSKEGDALYFYTGLTGISVAASVTWEASPRFGVTAMYRTLDFNGTSHRTSSMRSIGLQFKFNFVKNTRNVVPFFQAEFMFANSNHLVQQQASSAIYTQQVQPAFVQDFKSSLGTGADLGLEFKLSQPLSLVIMAGLHGIQIADKGDKEFTSALNYGVYLPPGGLDGMVFKQYSAGLKYYLGRHTKKREF